MKSTELIDWRLDDDHDLVITDDVQWITGLEAITQGVKIAVLMVKSEWFLDTDEGVPYFETSMVSADDALVGGKYNADKALAAFRSAILSAPGVNTIQSLGVSFDQVTRKLGINFIVKTVFDDTISGSITRGV